MTDRTQSLRERVISKASVVRKDAGAPAKLFYRPEVKICLERGRLMTRSYRETEGEPEVLRRAKALASNLKNMTIYIEERELIVGCYCSSPSKLPIYPEINEMLLENDIDKGFSSMIDKGDRQELLDICKYWHGKSMDDRIRALLPADVKDYVDFNSLDVANIFNGGFGLTIPDHEKLLGLGLNNIIKEIDCRLDEFQHDMAGLHADEYIEQKNSLEAMKIACEAVIHFAERFSHKAMEMAVKEPDQKRKKELENIAGICSRVPANPPETLWEALQSWYFSHTVVRLVEFCGHCCGDRLDQLMYPFYKRDLAEGRLTKEIAQELLECLWIKVEELGHLMPWEIHGLGGATLYQNFIIGGVTPKGEDASNEFSLLMIEAAISMKSPATNICLRYHPGINPEVVSKTIDCIRTGIGYPSIFNDTSIIPYIVNRGITIEDARNYSLPGCVVWSIPGKSSRVATSNIGNLSLGKCLELALNQGRDPYTGKQLGSRTPAPTTFTSFEDVMDAFLGQLRFTTEKMVKIDSVAQAINSRYIHRPYLSVLIDGCIEKGKDAITWREVPFPNIIAAGATDVTDSLAAIKKFVFEEKKLSMGKMLNALKNDFKGNEELRRRLINEVPKFGNDDDYVDRIARDVHHRSQKEVEKIMTYWGVPCSLEGSLAGGYFPWGHRVGAMPSGKKKGETFADGTISPFPGRDQNGPTAVIKSAGKVPPVFPELLNQRFMPQFLEKENKEIFTDYLRTWAELGCYHIQFNIVDDQILLDAKNNPDNYSDLVVRVAGYSAYFVDLSKGVQDEIIKRACHTF